MNARFGALDCRRHFGPCSLDFTGSMLNLEMMSNTLSTFKLRGIKFWGIQHSVLSILLFLVIISRSSIDLFMKSLISLILVRIFASVFRSINSCNSPQITPILSMSRVLLSICSNLEQNLLLSSSQRLENSAFSQSRLFCRRRITSLKPFSIFSIC